MFFIGKWKCKRIASFVDAMTFAFLSKEELDEKGLDYSNSADVFDTVLEFFPDGQIKEYLQMPNGELRHTRTHRWEEQDGDYVYFIDGDDDYLALNNEGLLKFNLGMALFEKI